MLPYLALLRMGFTLPLHVAAQGGALLPHPFTLTTSVPGNGRGGLLSVALSRGRPRRMLSGILALCSPDFPRQDGKARPPRPSVPLRHRMIHDAAGACSILFQETAGFCSMRGESVWSNGPYLILAFEMIMVIISFMRRLTAQRQAILNLINTSNRHWDADEISRALGDRGESVGIATVYRGLAALEDEGLIVSIQLADKKRYERADKAHHDHMVCTHCGSIEEFSQGRIESLQKEAAREKGFVMTGHQLVIFGCCARCTPEGKKQ